MTAISFCASEIGQMLNARYFVNEKKMFMVMPSERIGMAVKSQLKHLQVKQG